MTTEISVMYGSEKVKTILIVLNCCNKHEKIVFISIVLLTSGSADIFLNYIHWLKQWSVGYNKI